MTNPTATSSHHGPPLATPREPHDKSLPSLLGDLGRQLSALFTAEIALAKCEIRITVDEAKKATLKLALGASLLGGAGMAFVIAAIVGLAGVLPLWLAAVIVGVVLLGGGATFMWSGKRSMSDLELKPERTLRDVEASKRVIQSHLGSERAEPTGPTERLLPPKTPSALEEQRWRTEA